MVHVLTALVLFVPYGIGWACILCDVSTAIDRCLDAIERRVKTRRR